MRAGSLEHENTKERRTTKALRASPRLRVRTKRQLVTCDTTRSLPIGEIDGELYREADVGIEIILGVLIGVGGAIWFLARRAKRRL